MKNIRLHIDTNTFIRFWLVVIGFLLALGAIYLARNAIIMLLVAFFLALVLNRPVSAIARHLPGKSRVGGTLIAYLLILAVIGLVFFTAVPTFLSRSADFIGTLPSAISSAEDNSNMLADLVQKYNVQEQYDAALDNLKQEAGNIAKSLGSSFVSIVSWLMNGLINMLLVMVLTFLMLTEGPRWGQRFWRLIYRDQKKLEHHRQLAAKMYDVVVGYVNSQVIVATTSALASGLGAFVLAFIFDFSPSIALPTASIVFVTAFIPMFGALVGAIISAVLMLLYSPLAALFYIIYCTLYQQIENNWVSPMIQAKRTQMSALMVLAAATVGLQVSGILGALVAIPVAGCVMVLLRDFLRRRDEKYASAEPVADEAAGDTVMVIDETINVEQPTVKPADKKARKRQKRKG
jgi:predicted PurR-regulated permease PerM